MKRILSSIVMLLGSSLIILKLQAQIFPINNIGIQYYDYGSTLLRAGDYKMADSLFTMALCTYKDENVYFNRAITKLLLNDSCGYCADLAIAANRYYDKESAKLYNKDCCLRVDTIYYDHKFQKVSAFKYRYLEEIKYPKDSSQIIYGIIHRKGYNKEVMCIDYGCGGSMIGVRLKKRDIFALYLLIDSTKYFLITDSPARVKANALFENNKDRYIKYFKSKFKNFKDENNITEFLIGILYLVDDSGQIKGFYDCYTEIPIGDEILRTDLYDNLNRMCEDSPRLKPAKFKGKPVSSLVFDSIKF